VVACHQLAPELALDVRAASLVILVDATTTTPPATVTVRRLAPADEGADDGDRPGPGPGGSSHHVGPELLLALARELYGAAPEAVSVSVGVADLGPGEALTPGLAAALPAVADAVAQLVDEHLASRGSASREPA